MKDQRGQIDFDVSEVKVIVNEEGKPDVPILLYYKGDLSITKQKAVATEISPLVESLSGVIQLDENFNYRKDYSNHLAEKYK